MRKDLAGGFAAIAIGAFYLLLAFQLRASALADAVGPAGFPKLLGYLMVFLGVALCIQAVAAGRRATPRAVPDDVDLDEAKRAGTLAVLRAAGLLALGVAYLVLVPFSGYLVSIAALIVAVAIYQGTPPSWRVLAIGIGGALAYWLVFVKLLGIPLPGGMLGELL